VFVSIYVGLETTRVVLQSGPKLINHPKAVGEVEKSILSCSLLISYYFKEITLFMTIFKIGYCKIVGNIFFKIKFHLINKLTS
jgi:hypothetical protein